MFPNFGGGANAPNTPPGCAPELKITVILQISGKAVAAVLPSMPENLLLFLTTRIKKMAVWKTTFVSEHFNTD